MNEKREHIKLKGITWDHPRGYQPLVASSAIYEKEFGVAIEWYKRSLTEFGDQPLEELCKAYDLLIIDHPHVGLAERKKCLEPLGNILAHEDLLNIRSQSVGPSYLSYNFKSEQWALPVDAAMQSAVFRPDLIPNKNVPSDWDEVFKLAEHLKNSGSYLGIALSPTDCLCSFLSLTAQANSPIREENSQLVEKDAGLRVLERLKKMKENFHPECLQWTPVNLLDHMSAKDDVIYCPLAFCYNNYSRDDFRERKLVYDNAPGINDVVLGGAGIAVSSYSKYKKIAGAFSSWICSAEIQRTVYTDEQGQPGNILAWKDQEINVSTGNFFFNTIKTIENAYVRPRYNGWTEFQTIMGNVIHDFLEKERNPDDVLGELNILFQKSKIEK